MRALSAAGVLELWEWGGGLSPARRALGTVAWAHPTVELHDLESWTVGRRDAALLDVRRRLFGGQIAGAVACPQCAETVDLEFEPDQDSDQPTEGQANPVPLTWGEWRVRWRPLTCGDLLSLEGVVDRDGARRRLAAACVVEATCDGRPASPDEVPAELEALLSAAVAAADPRAGWRVGLTCPACGHGWEAPFDVAAFLWSEIETQARRLLDEVHRLARGYGWSEVDILAMTPLRRWAYLELLGG